jgi:hypothetical protein
MFTFHTKQCSLKLCEKTGLCEITACYNIENPKEVWQGWAAWADQNKDADFGDVTVEIDDTSDVAFLAADTSDDIALIVMAAKKRT